MNSASLIFNSRSHLIEKINTSDESFTALCLTITSGPPSYGYLLDPYIKKGAYYQNNFYITDRDDTYCYLTTEYHLDKEEYPPDLVLLNSLYGILFTLEIMLKNKIPKITITNSGKRYTISSENAEPIIIDPDLGSLYNETIPRIIARRVKNVFEYEVYNHPLLEEEYTYFFVQILTSPNVKEILEKFFYWSCLKTSNNEYIKLGKLILLNDYDTFISIKMREGRINLYSLIITKTSLQKFIEAWESRLQYSNTFTLVFLGHTLRFFEGESL